MPGETYLDRDGQLFVAPQSAWDAPLWPSAGHAIKFIEFTSQVVPVREPRTDEKGTRSEGATVELRKEGTWTIKAKVIPSGALGTVPDDTELNKGAYGTETINASTSVVYSLVKDLEAVFNGVTITFFGNHFALMLVNAIVDMKKFDISGESDSTIEFSGKCTDIVHIGSSTVPAGASSGAGSVTVATGDGPKFRQDAQAQIGSENSKTISGVVGDVVSFSPVLSGALASDAVIQPEEPVGTTSSVSPIPGIKGSFTYAGSAFKIQSGTITVNNNPTIRNDDYGSNTASGFDTGNPRQVTFEFQARNLKSNFQIYGESVLKSNKPIVVTLGDTPGQRIVLNMPLAEVDPSSFDPPGTDTGKINWSGRAVKTNGDDEITETHN